MSAVQNYEIQADGALIHDFESLTGVSVIGTGSTIELNSDLAFVETGTKSLKVNAASGVNTFITGTFASANLNGNPTFKLVIFWDEADYAKVMTGCTFNFSSDNFNTSKAVALPPITPGKNVFTIGLPRMTGTSNWNAITATRIRITPPAGSAAVVYIDSIKRGGYARPKVCVTFDDGYENVAQDILPLMSAAGLKATYYLCKNLVDSAPDTFYISSAEVQELVDAGWRICNHLEPDHLDMTTRTEQQLRDALDAQIAWLQASGWCQEGDWLHGAYPYGRRNALVLQILREYGFLTCRTTDQRVQAHDYADALQLGCEYVINTETVANIKTVLDNMTADGGVVFLVFHRFELLDDDESEWTIVKAAALILILALYNGSMWDVVTVPEWHEGLRDPALGRAA